MQYQHLKSSDVSDGKDIPSLYVSKAPKNKKEDSKGSSANRTTDGEESQTDSQASPPTLKTVALSAQNARAQVKCVECQKPRVIHCNNKLDMRHKMMLANNFSEFEFTCGSHLFPPDEKRKLALVLQLRPDHVMCNASGSSLLRE